MKYFYKLCIHYNCQHVSLSHALKGCSGRKLPSNITNISFLRRMFCLVLVLLPVEDREPDHALRLLLHPVQIVESLDELLVTCSLEA